MLPGGVWIKLGNPSSNNKSSVIVSNRQRVLPYGRNSSSGRHRQGVLAQARILKPSLGLVSKDPLDRAGCIVKSYNRVFPTRNDKRIVAGPISHRIIMKPVLPAANERARIISTRSHRVSDDLVHVPSLLHGAFLTDLQDNAFEVSSRVYLQE